MTQSKQTSAPQTHLGFCQKSLRFKNPFLVTFRGISNHLTRLMVGWQMPLDPHIVWMVLLTAAFLEQLSSCFWPAHMFQILHSTSSFTVLLSLLLFSFCSLLNYNCFYVNLPLRRHTVVQNAFFTTISPLNVSVVIGYLTRSPLVQHVHIKCPFLTF